MTDEGRKRIYGKIIDYLSRQGFSEAKLLQKVLLLKKRYPHARRYEEFTKDNVLEVLSIMRQEGIVDDERYASDVLRQLANKKNGFQLIRLKMRQRLIPELIIDQAISSFRSTQQQDYSIILRSLVERRKKLEKKYASHPRKAFMIRGSLQMYCLSRGYDRDEAQQLCEAALTESA